MSLNPAPQRPSLGILGRNIVLKANFFPINTLPGQDICHYSVGIVPEVHVSKSRKIYQVWEEESRKSGLLTDVYPIYDGKISMFTASKLPFQVPSVFQIDFFDPEELSGQRVPQKFKLTIQYVCDVNMYKLAWFLDGRITQVPRDAFTVLDCLLMHSPSFIYTIIGRSFYTPESSIPIANAAQLWQGFHQIIKPTQGQLLINLDVSATTFYEPGPVINLVAKILGRDRPSELRSTWYEKDRLRVEKALKGLRIVSTHRGEIKQKYKIVKLTSTPANRTLFNLRDTDQEVDVCTYFWSRYRLKLNYPHFPCLIVGDPSKHVYLPLEVCDILAGQRHLKKLNEKQTAGMIKFTCQPPQVRSVKIESGIHMLQQDDNPYFKEFNFEIGKEMITVNARVLPSPTISYHPSSKEPSITPREGTWNLRDKMVAQGSALRSWAVIVFGSEDDFPAVSVHKFINALVTSCEECGIYVPEKTPPISYNLPHNVEKVLSDIFSSALQAFQERPQLIICILPNTNVSLYAEIKRVSDTILGISTQCIQSKHMFAAKRQYCANVCLKINVKLGGMNSYLNRLPFVNDATTMIFGADLTHPTSGSGGSHSIASVVGSVDGNYARYAAAIRFQRAKDDRIVELVSMTIELINLYIARQSLHTKPQRIIFYRDGLSDVNTNQIVKFEVDALKLACESIEPGYRPALSFISVQKRHHARFFPMRREDMDRSGNILPGTVIENGVTHPSGLQGTSKPTHYHVLYDENKFEPDIIQDLTYKLCYLYCRATRSVSVCPPAYYARLVAARARFHGKTVLGSPLEHGESTSLDELSSGVSNIHISPGSSCSIQSDTTLRRKSSIFAHQSHLLAPQPLVQSLSPLPSQNQLFPQSLSQQFAPALQSLVPKRKSRHSFSSHSGAVVGLEKYVHYAAVKSDLSNVMYFM